MNEVNNEDKFNIIVDGVEKEATLITILEVASREFAIYSTDAENDMADILYSEIVKDQEGRISLVDVDDDRIKIEIINAINDTFKQRK